MMIIILVCVLYKQTKNDEHPVSTEMGVKNEGIYMSIGDFDKISKCSENHYTSIWEYLTCKQLWKRTLYSLDYLFFVVLQHIQDNYAMLRSA